MDNTHAPLISIVIPTRARIGTLRSCLKTCTAQDFDDCEFVVSDNVSDDGTEALVRDLSRSDVRFKYFNTGRRLGMAENYEFALSKTQGDYVGYIGDDDGLIPGGLRRLSVVMAERKPGAIISSCRPHYIWPGTKDPEGHLFIPPQWGKKTLRTCSGKEELYLFARRGKTNYLSLPSIYYGFCSRKAIDAARGATGRFFHSHTPDVYSAAAIASVTDYISVPFAFAMAGISRYSIGLYLHESVDAKHQTVETFYSENQMPCHPKVAQSISLPLTICEALLQVRDHVIRRQDGSRDLKIDVGAYLVAAMRHASMQSSSFYEKVKQDVLETGQRNDLLQEAASAIERYPHLGYIPNDITPRTLLFSHASFKGEEISDIQSAVTAYLGFSRRPSFIPSWRGTVSFLASAIQHPLYWCKFIWRRLAQITVDRS